MTESQPPTGNSTGTALAESIEAKELKSDISRDSFQKELDQAIKELRLADFYPDGYDFDAQTLEYEIKSQDVVYKHRFRQPGDEEESRKEAMSVIIRRNAGKLQGDDLIETISDSNPALKRYYDDLGTHVWGYPLEDNDDEEASRVAAEQWISLDEVITPGDQLSDEEAAEYGVTRKKDNSWNDLTLRHVIPESDKIKAARLIHGGGCFVISEKGKRIRSVKTKREFIVKQLFGVERQEDGSLSKPTAVVAYHFKEAGAKALGKFESEAQPTRTHVKSEGQPESRTTISISASKELFAQHIQYIQGGRVEGAEIKAIKWNDPRLKLIPAGCQRDAVFVYLNFLKS